MPDYKSSLQEGLPSLVISILQHKAGRSPESWGADAQGVKLTGVLEWGQMAARPAGGAARAPQALGRPRGCVRNLGSLPRR